MEPTTAIWILFIGATIVLAAIIDSASHHVRLPSMVGYLAIGWLLHRIDARWGVLGPSGHDAFALLADLGLVVLLFHVGLHSNLRRLIAKLKPAAVIWVVNVALSAVAGYAVARYWAGLPADASLIIATALTATSIGVAAGAWAAHGALDSPDGDLMLDVAELDDLSAVLLMAVVIAIVPLLDQPQPVVSAIVAAGTEFAIKLLAFAAVCYLFARYAEAPLSRFAAARKRAPQRMLTVAGAGILIAAIAGSLGFSLAIGALFAGLLFSRDPRAVRVESGFDDIHDLFMPFFFVGIGLNAEFNGGSDALLLGGALLVAAIFGKFVGAALPAAFVTSRRGAVLIGASMIPRAEIALVVAYQGSMLGVLTDAAYSAIVLVSVATCTIAPWLVSAVLHQRADGKAPR